MKNDENIVRFSAEEIAGMLARGEDLTDRTRLHAKTEAVIAVDTAGDPAWAGIDGRWLEDSTRFVSRSNATAAGRVSVDLDRDIVAHFEAESGQWRDKINAVLRSFIVQTSRGSAKRS